jgi:hypothetical protein
MPTISGLREEEVLHRSFIRKFGDIIGNCKERKY